MTHKSHADWVYAKQSWVPLSLENRETASVTSQLKKYHVIWTYYLGYQWILLYQMAKPFSNICISDTIESFQKVFQTARLIIFFYNYCLWQSLAPESHPLIIETDVMVSLNWYKYPVVNTSIQFFYSHTYVCKYNIIIKIVACLLSLKVMKIRTSYFRVHLWFVEKYSLFYRYITPANVFC